MKPTSPTESNSSRRAVAYLRVSTDEQTLGIDAQRAAIEQSAAASRIQITGWFVERGVSGACPLDKRTELLRCLDQLRDTRCQYLLIARRDRLARDVIAAATIERLVERAGASIQSAAGEGEGDTPESKLLRRMVDAFAEYERAILRGRVRAALAVKKTRQERVGNIPMGFQLAADRVHLEPDSREQQVIAFVRARRAEGLSLRKISAALETAGLHSTRSARWHPHTLRQILLRG